jgi:hypothetical protein
MYAAIPPPSRGFEEDIEAMEVPENAFSTGSRRKKQFDSDPNKVRVRKYFPETFLWESDIAG